MIARDSRLSIGVRWFSRPLIEMGEIEMPNAGQNETRCIEVPPGAGVLQLLVPSIAVAVFVDRYCVADRVEVLR
jgi:hypothetical protein